MLVEGLEPRQLFSVPPVRAFMVGSTLALVRAHSVQVVDDGYGNVIVVDKSQRVFRTLQFAGVTRLVVNGTNAGDNLSASLVTVDAVINSGRGHDGLPVSVVDATDDDGNVLVRATANVVINAGPGNDIFAGNNYGTGTFVFNGQEGNDSIVLIGNAGYHVEFNQ